jgi:hypothetical protein
MAIPKISLLPDKLDLALYAGDGVSIRLTITDNNDVPIPITGGITAQIRETRLDADPLADFNFDLNEFEPGVVVLSLNGVQTASLITTEDKFKGFWDVQWQAENQEPITLVQGKVECDADVTR